MANVAPPVPGTILGDRYAVIATGGEAPGYVELRARDQEVDVEIGLWWLRPELFADPMRRDAVIGAGVELRGLQDAALRTCYGVVRGAGGLWATWQAATGPGLVPAIDGTARPLGEVRRWLEAAARGLSALHASGLVHGRLVPADLASIGGVLKLAGGGLWRDVDPQAALRAWQVAGAEHYLAPEVRRFQPPTEASDTWSFAAIALELIAGVPGSQPDLARAAARRHPALGAVLVGAMSPDPGRRPALGALLEAVRNAAEAPYADAAPKGKPAARGGEASTLVGHASGDATRVERPAARPGAAQPGADRTLVDRAPPGDRASTSDETQVRRPRPRPSTAREAPRTQVDRGRPPSGAPPVVGPPLGAPAGDATRVERPKPPTRPPPIPRGRKPSSQPPPLAAAKPMRTPPGAVPKPGAFAPHPASFALPTPTTAPPAPRPSRPIVAVQPAGAQPGAGPVAGPPRASAAPQPSAQIPTPARVAMAGAIERARTAPPGEFVVAAVSLKGSIEKSGPIPLPPQAQPPVPDAPTGETPHVPKAKLRAISEVEGGRTYSVAPGQMGYLAPPKAVSDARRGAERRRWMLLIALIAAGAAVLGVVLALLL